MRTKSLFAAVFCAAAIAGAGAAAAFAVARDLAGERPDGADPLGCSTTRSSRRASRAAAAPTRTTRRRRNRLHLERASLAFRSALPLGKTRGSEGRITVCVYG